MACLSARPLEFDGFIIGPAAAGALVQSRQVTVDP